MLLRYSFSVFFFVFLLVCLKIRDAQGTINQGPSNVTFISGRTSLPIVLTCNVTGFASWIVNGTPYFTSQLLAGLVDGHSANEADIVINIPMNDTEYICVSNTQSAAVNSSSAFLYIAGPPAMVGNIMVDITTVIIDNDNVSFTLNWDEPFANFDPIVNYTITINCNDALLCPVMLTVTTTSASVNFTTNLSMMTPLSVTASNTVDVSDPTTIMIGVPDRVDNINILCGAVDLINQCNVTWNEMAGDMVVPISYNVYYFGANITNDSIIVNSSMATIDLPAVDSDVNVAVTPMNVFGSGPVSDIAMDEIMSSSVANATTTLDTPNENRTLHSITVTCTVNLDSTSDMCEVIATANGQMTLTGIAPLVNGVGMVTINELMCEVTYTITAGGTLNGILVGPRSSHGNITAGYCPIVMTTTSIATTTTMTDSTTLPVSTTPSIPPSTTPSVDIGPSSEDDGSNAGAIAGGVVGGIIGAIILVAVIIAIVYCCMKHREKSSRPVSPGDRAVFRPASGTGTGSGVKVQTLDRYGKPVPLEGDTADTGVELTGYAAKSPEFTVTTSGPSSTFQGNDYQSAPGDEKNRTPSAFMPEGSYDTLAPADEPTTPSAQVVSPAQNGQSNPNAPKLNYADLEQFTRKPASVKKSDPQPASQYAVIDPKSLQQGTYT